MFLIFLYSFYFTEPEDSERSQQVDELNKQIADIEADLASMGKYTAKGRMSPLRSPTRGRNNDEENKRASSRNRPFRALLLVSLCSWKFANLHSTV